MGIRLYLKCSLFYKCLSNCSPWSTTIGGMMRVLEEIWCTFTKHKSASHTHYSFSALLFGRRCSNPWQSRVTSPITLWQRVVRVLSICKYIRVTTYFLPHTRLPLLYQKATSRLTSLQASDWFVLAHWFQVLIITALSDWVFSPLSHGIGYHYRIDRE